MTIHLVTFSDESMSRSAQLCIESAEQNGVDDSLRWEYPLFLHTVFYHENRVLRSPRGLGYWAWKPWIINQLFGNHYTGDQFARNSITRVQDGDIVIYADAGIEFIAPVSHIIDRMDQDIFLFGNNWEHAHWCKRDVIEAVWPWWERGRMDGDREVFVFSRFYKDNREQHWINVRELAWERFRKQVQASVIFFRVSDYTRKFVKEWLHWCLFDGGRLIDDSPSRLPNHPEFQEHRHDQAILTTMAYREGISLHYWPAVYNLGYPLPRGGFVYEKLACYANDDYPSPLFHHHRRRNIDWKAVV